MIQFVQNGKYRTTEVAIKRFINGVETPGDGFPKTERIGQPFGIFADTTDTSLMELTDLEYNSRVTAFNAFLISNYPFLSDPSFVNASSGTDETLCVPGLGSAGGTIPITNKTEIIIFFDSSGSMNTTLAPLVEMRNTLLKNVLLPFYGMDSALYDAKVKVISDSSERTLLFLNNRNNGFLNPTLVMVFQDESNSVGSLVKGYTSSTSIAPIRPDFLTDMAALRASLGNFETNYYRGIIFQVIRTAGEGTQFKYLIQAIESGTSLYTLPNNLSDKPEIGYMYDVLSGNTPQYYMDLIVNKMRDLGYRI